LNLGGLWRISGSIVGGTVLTNVTAAKIGESGEGIPRTTAIGLGLMPEEGYHIYLDWFKDERFPPENRMGIEIDKIRWIVFRMGASTRPINISGGLEFRARPCKVNYAFYWHNQLGWTNIFGIGFKLGRGLD
jgi:hypothetical protein